MLKAGGPTVDRPWRPRSWIAIGAVVVGVCAALGGWLLLGQSHRAPDGTDCGSVLSHLEGATYVDEGTVKPCWDLPVFSYRWGWLMFLGGLAITLVAVGVVAVRSQREPLT